VCIASLAIGALASIYLNIGSVKHKYTIDPRDPQFSNISNTLGAFQTLKQADLKCAVRVTAPFENRNTAEALRHLGRFFCTVEPESDPSQPQEDVLRDAVTNGIVIHMAKDQQRDGFVTEMGNVFSIKRTFEMPANSSANLVWIQIGHGYPFKNDDWSSSIQ